MANLNDRMRARKIIRHFGRFKKKTTTVITGKLLHDLEFSLIMKAVRDWIKSSSNGSYVGVAEKGKTKLHYHAIVWKVVHDKPTPLSTAEFNALKADIHSRIHAFRRAAAKTHLKNAMRRVLLSGFIEPAVLNGVNSPFYKVELKKKGVPVGYSGMGARYVLKTITQEDQKHEFVTSSGMEATIRHIKENHAKSAEQLKIPVLNISDKPFGFATVSILVNAVNHDLDCGRSITDIAHRWKYGQVLIRYDNLKLIRN